MSSAASGVQGLSLVVWHLDLGVITAGVEGPRVRASNKRGGSDVGSGMIGLYLKMKSVNLGEGLLPRVAEGRWPRQGGSGTLSVCSNQGVSSWNMQNRC